MTAHQDLDPVLAALGAPCSECARAIEVLCRAVTHQMSLDQVARAQGLTGAAQLARRMRKHGFPPLLHLRDWLWLTAAVGEYERTGQCLEGQAFAIGRDPSVLRRVVKRTAGGSWAKVRGAGFAACLRLLFEQVGARVRCGRQGATGGLAESANVNCPGKPLL